MSDSSGLTGHLLCAVPQLLDPNFERAVVLMLEHNDEGALGLVLTDELPTALSEVVDGLDLAWEGDATVPIRKGGPVEPSRGWILHGQPQWDPHAQNVRGNLWLTTSLDEVDRRQSFSDDDAFLFLLGYAGWGPRQIESEIATGSWVAVPLGDAHAGVPPGWVFEVPPHELWSKSLGVMGIDPARLVGLPNRDAALH